MTDIAFFLVDLSGGGAEKVMLSLANGFAEKGFKVEMVFVKLQGEYLPLISSKVKAIDLNNSRLISSLPLLVKYLRKKQPKVLISALEDANLLSIIAKWIAGGSTRLVITVHNHISRSSRESNQIKRKITPWFVRLFYNFADEIVSVSQGVAKDLAKISSGGLSLEKIKVIYNPIFTDDLLEKIHQPVSHPWFLDNQVPIVLAVGRLTQQKDFPTLIRAFALVKQQYAARLMILGQGEELPYLKSLVQELNLLEDVVFPGFVDNPYAYMSQAKLLVLSSAYEGFGNVLVEAMIAGTSVVSTNCESGPAEILENGKYGKLVPVGDVTKLANAIVYTLINPVDSAILRQRGQQFSLEAALEKYQKTFNLESLNIGD